LLAEYRDHDWTLAHSERFRDGVIDANELIGITISAMEEGLIEWLLDSDPAIRWQVERDLIGESKDFWSTTRARIAHEGFGSHLLELQDADGQWAGGAFFPKDFDFKGAEAQAGAGQPWTATTWSLNSLREWGLDASILTDTAERLKVNCRWEYEGLPYWDGEVDCCINSYTLANGVWLGADVEKIAQWFLDHQLPDGGWNCEWIEGSVRSSFHSTLNALKGLLWYESNLGKNESIYAARKRGEEYLLERNLMRRLETGELVAPWVTEFTYPFRWRYNVLNAADYFRSASLIEGTPPDHRMKEAMEAIRSQQQPDGSWLQFGGNPGRTWFPVDVAPGEPSKWLTLSALRTLNWWET
jgi:hypothetical protein